MFKITGTEIELVAPDCWLGVLPQLIARMHVRSPEIYKVLQSLLTKVGVTHPQALVCPISVARNTQNDQQKMVAIHVVNKMRKKTSGAFYAPTSSSTGAGVGGGGAGAQGTLSAFLGTGTGILPSQTGAGAREREWGVGGQLVEEATMVSRELMRVAISPQELWKEALERAYGQYMGRELADVPHATRVALMLQTLSEMHDALEDSDVDRVDRDTSTNTNKQQKQPQSQSNSNSNEIADPNQNLDQGQDQDHEFAGFSESTGNIGSTTLRDIAFRHAYGRELAQAKDLLEQFRSSGLTVVLHQLWELYFGLIMKFDKNISQQKKVQLHHVSRELTSSRDLILAVPGTYSPNQEVVSIAKFVNTLTVITSKQRPRRMAMLGSNGQKYEFLLKGKEDLRQDERVMQLFGLINVCLANSRTTKQAGLAIVRYSVLPLSNNSGVIGWVQNCDTFHGLLASYREERNIPLTLEPSLLRAKVGGGNHIRKYDALPLLNKVEIFQEILEETTGQDLEKMLWLKSRTADVWVQRRENFTRSVAVTSIVGYILGLGDRHMANVMLDRVSGRVIHIDFGDCFEVNKTRAQYPETIPFRLTRMMRNGMGTSGMAGTFKITADGVMNVLRANKDSVMAMLEAFVYDPMVGWKVLASSNVDQNTTQKAAAVAQHAAAAAGGTSGGSSITAMTGTGMTDIDELGINQSTDITDIADIERREMLLLTQSLVQLQSMVDPTGTGTGGMGVANGYGSPNGPIHTDLGDEEMDLLMEKDNGISMTVSHTFAPNKIGTFNQGAPMASLHNLAVGSLRGGALKSAVNASVSTAGTSALAASLTASLSAHAQGTKMDPSAILAASLSISQISQISQGTMDVRVHESPRAGLGSGSGSGPDSNPNSVSASVSGGTLRSSVATGTGDGSTPEAHKEDLNARAVEIINRINSKLTGRDFVNAKTSGASASGTNGNGGAGDYSGSIHSTPILGLGSTEDDLTVEEQVDRLIGEATSDENLCQLYSGWQPWW